MQNLWMHLTTDANYSCCLLSIISYLSAPLVMQEQISWKRITYTFVHCLLTCASKYPDIPEMSGVYLPLNFKSVCAKCFLLIAFSVFAVWFLLNLVYRSDTLCSGNIFLVGRKTWKVSTAWHRDVHWMHVICNGFCRRNIWKTLR